MYLSHSRLTITIIAGLFVAVACSSSTTRESDATPAALPSIAVTPAAASPTATAPPSPRPAATPKPTPVPVPPKPTGATFDERVLVSDDGAVVEITQTVTWGGSWGEGVVVRVYGVTQCIAEPPDPSPGTSGPCLVVHTPLPASVRTLLATASASEGVVSWTWSQEGGDCDIGYPAHDRDGPDYHAVVLAAYGAEDHSIFAIAEPGRWWRAALGDIVC